MGEPGLRQVVMPLKAMASDSPAMSRLAGASARARRSDSSEVRNMDLRARKTRDLTAGSAAADVSVLAAAQVMRIAVNVTGWDNAAPGLGGGTPPATSAAAQGRYRVATRMAHPAPAARWRTHA
jgi:hypothetical protein